MKDEGESLNEQRPSSHAWGLFLAVLLRVSLHCLFSVPSGVDHMAPRCVRMVGRLLVIARVVILGRFPVVAGGMRKMF